MRRYLTSRTVNKDREDMCSDKAEREIGVSFRPLSATMDDTVRWFRSQHMDEETKP
jgi:hypothetical protein